MIDADRYTTLIQYPASRDLALVSPSHPAAHHQPLLPPATFLSDMLMAENYKTAAFSLQLARFHTRTGQAPFLCLTLQFSSPSSEVDNFRDAPGPHALIARKIQKRGGIMAWLSPVVLVMAISLPHGTATASQMAAKIQADMAEELAVTITMGAAVYPHLTFTPDAVFHHAIRALDHARFYPRGATTFVDAATFNISGDRRYALENFESALTEYHTGLLLDPGDVNLLNSLGVCYSVLNRFEPALAQFEKILSLMPDDVPALYNAGLTCHLMAAPDQSARFLTRASHLDNSVYEIEFTAGIVAAIRRNGKAALAHLHRAAELMPRAGAPLSLCGDVYRHKKEFSQALTAYTRAIKHNPCDSWAMSGMARVYEIRNTNLSVALSLACQSIELTPEIPRFYLRLGRIYLKCNDHAKAWEAFSRGYALYREPKTSPGPVSAPVSLAHSTGAENPFDASLDPAPPAALLYPSHASLNTSKIKDRSKEYCHAANHRPNL